MVGRVGRHLKVVVGGCGTHLSAAGVGAPPPAPPALLLGHPLGCVQFGVGGC